MDGGYRQRHTKTFFWTPDTGLGFDQVTSCKYRQGGQEVLAKQTQ